jgi:hypothetical protein
VTNNDPWNTIGEFESNLQTDQSNVIEKVVYSPEEWQTPSNAPTTANPWSPSTSNQMLANNDASFDLLRNNNGEIMHSILYWKD